MKILSIDTSAVAASASVVEDGLIVCESFTNIGLQHSRTLMPMVESMLKYTEISLDEIDLFAVSKGPGSFTGVRIGISVVKGMATALGRECVGVSTLEALAYNMTDCDGIICPVMDARCSQVYNAVFECYGGALKRKCDDRAISADALFEELKGLDAPIFLVGDGAGLCFELVGNKLPKIRMASPGSRFQRASSVALAAQAAFERGESTGPAELMPSYLRPPQAVRNLKSKGSERK